MPSSIHVAWEWLDARLKIAMFLGNADVYLILSSSTLQTCMSVGLCPFPVHLPQATGNKITCHVAFALCCIYT